MNGLSRLMVLSLNTPPLPPQVILTSRALYRITSVREMARASLTDSHASLKGIEGRNEAAAKPALTNPDPNNLAQNLQLPICHSTCMIDG